jgi:hypothetical protein
VPLRVLGGGWDRQLPIWAGPACFAAKQALKLGHDHLPNARIALVRNVRKSPTANNLRGYLWNPRFGCDGLLACNKLNEWGPQ